MNTAAGDETYPPLQRYGQILAVLLLCGIYLVLSAPEPSFFLTSKDHGYQLALAQATLDRRIQGVDFFTLYGPLVGATSALARYASGNLLGEIILCSAGYALSIALAFAFVRRWSGGLAAWIAVILLLVFIPRYYKWYYWLVPVLSIFLYGVYLRRSLVGARSGYMILGWGIAGGVGFLLRQDLGLVTLMSGLLMVAATQVALTRSYSQIWRSTLVEQGYLVTGWVVPVLLWFGFLLAMGGGDGLLLYIRSIFDASADVVKHYSIPLPELKLSALFLGQSKLASAHALVLSVYGIGVFWSLFRIWRRSSPSPGFCLAAMGASIVGIAVFPQAIYRADYSHLFQVIAPFILLTGLLFGNAIALARAGRWGSTVVGVVVAVWLATVASGAERVLAMDLSSPFAQPLTRLGMLADLPDSMAGDPEADAAVALRDHTVEGQPVFLPAAWTSSPILAMAERSLGGIIPVYAPGILVGEPWRTINRQRLERHPPAAIVVEKAHWRSAPAFDLAPYNVEIIEQWRATYTRVLHENARYRVLAKPVTNY